MYVLHAFVEILFLYNGHLNGMTLTWYSTFCHYTIAIYSFFIYEVRVIDNYFYHSYFLHFNECLSFNYIYALFSFWKLYVQYSRCIFCPDFYNNWNHNECNFSSTMVAGCCRTGRLVNFSFTLCIHWTEQVETTNSRLENFWNGQMFYFTHLEFCCRKAFRRSVD